jgi:hypothetical protein
MAKMGMLVHDGIGPVLDYLAINAATNVAEAFEAGAQEVEYYAQGNAPWSDITGEARGGLTAEVYLEDGQVTLELYHTAEHGYWLELIQDGRFAIIMPTLEALGPGIIRDAGGRVMQVGGGF